MKTWMWNSTAIKEIREKAGVGGRVRVLFVISPREILPWVKLFNSQHNTTIVPAWRLRSKAAWQYIPTGVAADFCWTFIEQKCLRKALCWYRLSFGVGITVEKYCLGSDITLSYNGVGLILVQHRIWIQKFAMIAGWKVWTQTIVGCSINQI